MSEWLSKNNLPRFPEAKKQLTQQDVDLILLDLSLEGDEDGLALVRYLRATDRWRDLPVIAITGMPSIKTGKIAPDRM